MTDIDTDALSRSYVAARDLPGHATQFDGMLADGRSEREVQEFAAYVCQSSNLNLKPWQEPPCVADEDDDDRDQDAQRLLRKMLAAGISRYEPDPLRAMERTKRRRPAGRE